MHRYIVLFSLHFHALIMEFCSPRIPIQCILAPFEWLAVWQLPIQNVFTTQPCMKEHLACLVSLQILYYLSVKMEMRIVVTRNGTTILLDSKIHLSY